MGVITSKETITPDKNDSVSNHGKTVSDHFGSRDDDESSDESSYHSFEEDNMSCYAENIGLKDNSTGENGEDTSTDGAVPDLRERGSISDDDMSINRDGLDLDNDDGNLSISDGDQLWPCGDNDAIRSSGNDSIVVINKDEKLATNETHPPPTQLLVTPTRDYVFCIDGYRHETILFREDRSLPEKQRRSSGEILKALANQIHTGAKSCVCIATGCECAFGLVSSLISHLHTKHAIKLVATDGSSDVIQLENVVHPGTALKNPIKGILRIRTRGVRKRYSPEVPRKTVVKFVDALDQRKETRKYWVNSVDRRYPPQACPVCGEGFKKSHIHKHIRYTHPGAKAYRCFVSGCVRKTGFFSLEGLIGHLIASHEKTEKLDIPNNNK